MFTSRGHGNIAPHLHLGWQHTRCLFTHHSHGGSYPTLTLTHTHIHIHHTYTLMHTHTNTHTLTSRLSVLNHVNLCLTFKLLFGRFSLSLLPSQTHCHAPFPSLFISPVPISPDHL